MGNEAKLLLNILFCAGRNYFLTKTVICESYLVYKKQPIMSRGTKLFKVCLTGMLLADMQNDKFVGNEASVPTTVITRAGKQRVEVSAPFLFLPVSRLSRQANSSNMISICVIRHLLAIGLTISYPKFVCQ